MTELRKLLGQPVDIAWLGAFRAVMGTILCVSMLRFIAYGWIDRFFIKPTFHFKYYGFDWVEPLSRVGMHALFWTLALLAFLIAIGAFFRVAALLFLLGFTYLQLIDVTIYLNHYYLAALLVALLAISPAHRWGSFDAWRVPSHQLTHVPALWLYLFRIQVGVVYTFAGLAKAHGDWLWHGQPLGIWLGSQTDLPLLGPLFMVRGMPELMSWAGFLFDTSVPWLLLMPRVRPYAFMAVIGFHVVTRALFPIGMFPFIMVSAALVFFSASWPRRILELVRLQRGGQSESFIATQSGQRVPAWAALAFLSYATFQVAMPMRHLAYGGDVRWHEQGMRFSWRVMLREKNGDVTFVVQQKSTGKQWYASPRSYLTRMQEREMAGQPDLVLQLAHHIRQDCLQRGLGEVEVRVDAKVSLNGRRMQPMIDPQVDLASVRDGFGKADWILPAPEGPPPHVRPI